MYKMRVTGLHDFHGRVVAVVITFFLTSISFKDRPFLHDINDGSLNISLSNGCFLLKCHLFMMICLFQIGHWWLILRYKRQDSFSFPAFLLEG